MEPIKQIMAFINQQTQPLQGDLKVLHSLLIEMLPDGPYWFMDGRNDENKIVSNPNLGYGKQILKYADGTTKEFYQIGISPNKTGISIYILGLADNKHIKKTYDKKIGKASVTTYCIKFKSINDINLELLKEAILFGINSTK